MLPKLNFQSKMYQAKHTWQVHATDLSDCECFMFVWAFVWTFSSFFFNILTSNILIPIFRVLRRMPKIHRVGGWTNLIKQYAHQIGWLSPKYWGKNDTNFWLSTHPAASLRCLDPFGRSVDSVHFAALIVLFRRSIEPGRLCTNDRQNKKSVSITCHLCHHYMQQHTYNNVLISEKPLRQLGWVWNWPRLDSIHYIYYIIL